MAVVRLRCRRSINVHSLQYSIGRPRALAMFASKWWLTRGTREIAKFQLFTTELCLPFSIFHRALEEALHRPIWIHEFGFSAESLALEFLDERDPPSLEEIFALVPQGHTCGVIVESSEE